MEKKHFFITEKEYLDIIFFRRGSAFSLLIRLFEFFTQKKINFQIDLVENIKVIKSHYMIPTFSKMASQEFIWAEDNHRSRKLFLLKSLEEHKIFLDKVKKNKNIKEFIKTKKLTRKKQKINKKDKKGDLRGIPDTQTEMIILKNYNNTKNNESELSKENDKQTFFKFLDNIVQSGVKNYLKMNMEESNHFLNKNGKLTDSIKQFKQSRYH